MDTDAIIARLRRVGCDLSEVEAKSAAGGFPKTVVESLSAFANAGGGTVLLGLDERNGFAPAAGFAADRIRDALVNACANGVEPSLRVPIDIEEIDDYLVVRADIPELDPIDKPCFVKTRGAYQGSFIRSGDGDLLLTHYEVTQLLANRTQPMFDAEPVERATPADLDRDLVDRLLERVRKRSTRGFAGLDDLQALHRMGVLTVDGEGVVRPTLAGIQSVGVYPQEYFPQLFVSFVVLPGLHLGDAGPGGVRFVDNATIDGPIPHMVAEATAVLRRNMRSASIVTGLGRQDRYDYPIEVFREILVNALMHRDYSPHSRGTQIQVELYPDRLVVKSPGGIHGAARVQVLGTADQVSSSRNAVLSRILADVELPNEREVICENRGSGLPNVVRALRQAGMSPPAFEVGPGHTTITVPQHALLAVDVVEWIGGLGQHGLTDAQHLALAIMRSAGRVTNSMLQAWGLDRVSAGSALRDLVDRDLASMSGGKRYASYRLNDEGVSDGLCKS